MLPVYTISYDDGDIHDDDLRKKGDWRYLDESDEGKGEGGAIVAAGAVSPAAVAPAAALEPLTGLSREGRGRTSPLVEAVGVVEARPLQQCGTPGCTLKAGHLGVCPPEVHEGKRRRAQTDTYEAGAAPASRRPTKLTKL